MSATSIDTGTTAISDEHVELHRAVRRWVEGHVQPKETKARLDDPVDVDALPTFWPSLVSQGWLGLHVDEANGGQGYGLPELCVVLDELGRACAPGPFLPTVVVSHVLQRALADGSSRDEVREELATLAAGDRAAAFGLPTPSLVVDVGDGGGAVVTGSVRPVLCAGVADRFLLVAADGTACLLDRSDVSVTLLPSTDGTRRVGSVEVDAVAVPPGRVLRLGATGPALRDALAVLASAEASGSMAWCTEVAASYASERVQFGRPIGQFQAVKHRCADMLLTLEQSRAASWDAARAVAARPSAEEVALAAGVAGAVAADGFLDVAKDCVQVLGGIGYTWEHDAHLYLKRAVAMQALVGRSDGWRRRVAALAASGTRRSLAIELPPEAEGLRGEVHEVVASIKARPREEWTAAMAEVGYLVPYWPAPWGRDASPIEQIVIDEELAAERIRRPHLQVGAWVLPTIINHGTVEQQERWVPQTLRGEILWCQLFSEPGAGSDLASLSTKAVRDDERGGWRITGQKVWTTMAHIAQWGLLLARTDAGAAKHDGITAFVVDMATPGIETRPLRELTGAELFNEVFFTDAFIPDDCVVGEVDHGWEAARTTLANERVSMGSGSSFGPGVESIVKLAGDEPAFVGDVGSLVVEAQVLAVLGQRTTLRALMGAAPGAEASVRKLLSTEHDQRVQEVGLAICGERSAIDADEAAPWIAGFLGNRALSIAGGTSDVQRNIVAERLLGLPKDP